MYKSALKENSRNLNINIPWDSNTAKGFGIAMLITSLIWLLTPYFNLEQPKPREVKRSIPIELLNFGSGDGTGLKSGNLTEEGASVKGDKPEINIEDAQISSNTKVNKNVDISEIDQASKFNTQKELESKNKSQTKIAGDDQKSVGTQDGSDIAGSGLKNRGSGRGAGDGFGDIDWGGGGNRVLISKKLPKFPSGVKSSAKIELRFKVLSDGTVSHVIPIKKADPELELAAINAIKQWRFNPLPDSETEMWGTIPLTFILR